MNILNHIHIRLCRVPTKAIQCIDTDSSSRNDLIMLTATLHLRSLLQLEMYRLA